MNRITIETVSLALALSTVAGCAHVQSVAPHDACGDLPELQHQHQDAATVRHLETAWSVAFLRGDTQLMGCLLIPEYTEIMRSGALKHRSDELEMAAKNQGKNLAIPDLPQADVLLHDNVAVAFGQSLTPGPDGQVIARRFADSFVWEQGRWRAVFSQQTPVAP
jgi:hypothetical protein